MTTFFDGWSNVINNMDMGKREPVWQKAIEILIAKGDLGPTIADTLSQDHMQDMIFDKGIDEEVSIYDIFKNLGCWVDANWDNYLGYYFFNGREVTLAYLMATQYGLFWDGDDNVQDWIKRIEGKPQST